MIVVAGENVADLVPAGDGLLRVALGGGPANVAVAAAKLGAQVAMVARLGNDAFAASFRTRLIKSTIDIGYAVTTQAPSALALATVAESGEAHYDFWLNGAADFGWQDQELPNIPAGSIIHIGSLAAFLQPGADALERWVARHHRTCIVSFDPNLRPIALAQPDALARLERLVELSAVVRCSEQDLAAAYAHTPEWVRNPGERLVVVTRGAAGATAYIGSAEISVPAPRVSVVDTIGAGDAATGAMLAWIDKHGWDDVRGMLAFMCEIAAASCTHAGAG